MDLSTTYMGLKLKNPLVPAASPLSQKVDSVRAMEDAGASAVTIYSLFEEQIRHEQNELNHYLSRDENSHAEALSYFPDLGNYKIGPEAYLEHISKLKEAVDIPIIGSLNGTSNGGWIDYAAKIEKAGASALELNIYQVAADPSTSGVDVEQKYIDIVTAVKKSVKIPVAVKLSPYFSSTANMAKKLDEAGADGLVLFNRFYQPDIDLENLEVTPNVVLSTSASARLPMRWLAILFGQVKASLAASSGVHTAEDVVKMLAVGADITTMASALLKHGVWHLASLREGLEHWLEAHDYESVKQLKGSLSQRSTAEPAVFERANYMKALDSLG
ncbi:MAG: dihydroorotate dehydrogenase [Deltaproteobacteria bacterium RIFOXYA12_FULL_58_15]|nr:MAG: dihydroorotate dehydrogenase [Deltaproteobacteria bacterium RIFOXYA12_FULL_58_15]